MSTEQEPEEARAAANRQVFRTSVFIKAAPKQIWEALTQSEWTQRYGFEAPVEYDLRRGGSFRVLTPLARAELAAEAGRRAPEHLAEGQVLQAQPPNRLVTTFRFAGDERLAAAGEAQVSYLIQPTEHDVTTVTVTVTGPPEVVAIASGEGHAVEVIQSVIDPEARSVGGFDWVLNDLKSLLETGNAFKESARNG